MRIKIEDYYGIDKRQWAELKKSMYNFPEGWTKKDNEGSWIYKGQWRKII